MIVNIHTLNDTEYTYICIKVQCYNKTILSENTIKSWIKEWLLIAQDISKPP